MGSPVRRLDQGTFFGASEGPEVEGDDGSSDWKERMGSFFSPVLRFLGGSEQADDAELEDDAAFRSPASAVVDAPVEMVTPPQADEGADAAPDLTSPAGVRHTEEEGAQSYETAESATDDEESCEFNSYLFMKQLPPYAQVREYNKICLPPRKATRSNLPTLVLDLDETLVHCTIEEIADPDHVFPVEFNGTDYRVYVRVRPHLDRFLTEVADMFEVVVFTASQRVYADTLLDIIDPQRRRVKHRLFREACLFVDGNYLKDLNVLGRDLAKTVLVDNSPHAFGYQVDNGIPIESWYDDPSDTELLKLLDFLKRIRHAEDVRPLVAEEFRTNVLIANA